MLVVIIAMAVWSTICLVDDTVAAHALQIVCALFYSSVLFFAHPTLQLSSRDCGHGKFLLQRLYYPLPVADACLVILARLDWIFDDQDCSHRLPRGHRNSWGGNSVRVAVGKAKTIQGLDIENG